MVLAPTDYDFGNEKNYSFATKITCKRTRKLEDVYMAFGHMLNIIMNRQFVL